MLLLRMRTISSAALWGKNQSGERPLFIWCIVGIIIIPIIIIIIDIIIILLVIELTTIWRAMMMSDYLQRFNTKVAYRLEITHNHARLKQRVLEVSMTVPPLGGITLVRVMEAHLPQIVALIFLPSKNADRCRHPYP